MNKEHPISKKNNMTEKFQNKYRIPSTRLQHWDYGQPAAYFVTICTQGRQCFFGQVADGKMHLSGIGIIADILWYEIKNHAQNIELGAFVVMPNHMHGILILNGNDDNDGINDINVETTHALSLQSIPPTPPIPPLQSQNQTPGQKRFQNQGKNTLSSIIGSYKSGVTKHAHRLGFEFAWQSRFYEHIIRNEKSFHRITEYIKNNPIKWQKDDYYAT